MEDKPLSNPYDAPPHQPPPAKSATPVGWIIAVVLLGVMVLSSCLCIPLLVALLLPAVQSAREAARRMESSNNLKQIGLAMHNYHTMHGTFPPAYIPDEDGRPMTSWRTLILPYLEQQNLYDEYDFDRPWDDPVNASLTDVDITLYQSPRETNKLPGMTNYVAITGEGTAMPGGEAITIADIRDGISGTILVVEILNSDIPWTEPRDLDIDNYQRVDEGADPEATNVISRNAVMAFADGSVHVLAPDVTREALRLLIERNDGQAPPMW